MAIDLRKNKDSLLKAYNDVVADNNSIDWAVFTYEGQTTVLKLAETGEGSIEDLLEELNSSKIMYAFCKVMDPNTSLPKYVLINWQGEAATESMKFKCANHLRDVKAFFHGSHVTVNARSEADIDENDIIQKVAKSSGSQYSIHKEKAKPQDREPSGPVGSVYQKTQAAKEINIKQRDQFWAKTEKEEVNRIAEERREQMIRQESLETERKQREAQEAELREKQVQERMKTVHQQKAAERRASQTENEEQKRQWEAEQQKAYQEEEERRLQADHARKARAAEAQSLASQKASNARDFFQRKASGSEDLSPAQRGPPPPRKLKHTFGAVDQDEPPQGYKQPIELPREQPSPPPTHVREPSPPRREPSPPRRQPSPPRRESSPPRREPSPPRREPSPTPQVPSEQPQRRSLLAENLPHRQPDSDDEQNDDDDWGEDGKTEETPQNVPAVQAPHIPEPEPAYQPEPEPEPEPAPTTGDFQPGPHDGQCARALYDYQAADETEITFDPDDIITQVEQIDPGWWTGVAPDGSRGMFPANYVELING